MIFHIDSKQSKRIMTERELRTIVDVSHEDGVIEEAEKDMLNNVFDFKESLAKDIMIPRIDVTFVSVDASYEEVLEIFREAGYSKIMLLVLFISKMYTSTVASTEARFSI